VLFNVFASVERGERAQGGDVIGVWAGAAGGGELAGAYRSVLGHLITSLAGLRTSPDRSQLKEEDGKVKTVLQMLDILLVLAPYLPVVQKAEVVDIVVRGGVLDVSDGVCSGHEVGASLAAEKDHTISAGVMALFRVLFDFESTLRLFVR